MISEQTVGHGLSRRGFLLGSLAGGISVPLLASCGGGSGDGSSGKPVGLSFWSRDSGNNGAMEPVLKQRLQAFDKANKATTNVQFYDLTTSSQKETAGLTGGGLPTLGEQGQDVSMEFAEGGHLLALDDVYNDLKSSYISLPKAAFTQLNGHTYALPWWFETRVLWYHKDLLSAADVQPPTSWDEWLSAAKKLTKGTSQYGFVLEGGTNLGQIWAPLAAAAGGTLLNASGNLDTTPDAWVTSAEFLQNLYQTSMPKATPTYTNGTEADQLFIQKKAAMIWDNGELLASINSTNPSLLSNVGAVLTPPMDTGGVSRSFLGGFEIFAFEKGEGSSHAQDLIKFLMTDPSFYSSYIKAAGDMSLPVIGNSASKFDSGSDLLQTLVKQVSTAVRYAGPLYATQGYLGNAEPNNVFVDPIVALWSGKSTAQDAVKGMFTALQKLEAGS